MRDPGDCFDIRDFRIRISECFDIERLRVVLYRPLKIADVERIHEGCRHAIIHQRVREQVVCTAIDILCRDDVPAVLRQVLDRVGHRRCA